MITAIVCAVIALSALAMLAAGLVVLDTVSRPQRPATLPEVLDVHVDPGEDGWRPPHPERLP